MKPYTKEQWIQIEKELKEAGKELKQANDNFIPPHREDAIRALIALNRDPFEREEIYKFIIDNENYMDIPYTKLQLVIIDLERCDECGNFERSDDLNASAYYANPTTDNNKICPNCIRDVSE